MLRKSNLMNRIIFQHIKSFFFIYRIQEIRIDNVSKILMQHIIFDFSRHSLRCDLLLKMLLHIYGLKYFAMPFQETKYMELILDIYSF